MVAMASLSARRAFSTSARRLAGASEDALRGEAKRNPELYVRRVGLEDASSFPTAPLIREPRSRSSSSSS